MKVILLLILLIATIGFLCMQFTDHTNKHPVWSKETMEYRERLRNIITPEVNAKQTTWVSGHNYRWNHLSLEQIKLQMGELRDDQVPWEPVQLPIVDKVIDGLPDYFDPRDQWPKCQSIREVRDQSVCGSCWAHGAAESMSDRWCIFNDQKSQDRIAVEQFMSCCDSCGFGCYGGQSKATWEYYINFGVVTGNANGDNYWCQPYEFPNCDHHTTGQYEPCGDTQMASPCKYECTAESGRDFASDRHYGESAYHITNIPQAIQTELYLNGPVEASFTVYEDFLTYKSGVYQHTTGAKHGGHAIKMMGWGVENGTPYWLCANSWNADWGDKGFFKILRGSDECGIESDIYAGIPKVK